MFTGLIETVGTISDVKVRSNYRVLRIASSLPTSEIEIGESIACSGPCLTVTQVERDWFEVEMSQETLERIVVSKYETGRLLNLERALRVGDRLGGHFVSGHIDGTGNVEYLRPIGDSLELAVNFDVGFDPLVVEKGSIAVDGVSLTVNSVNKGRFTVNLIPHSFSATTLSGVKAGEGVNLEYDLIGKYMLKFSDSARPEGVSVDALIKSGW